MRYKLGKTYELHADHQPALEHLHRAMNIFRGELGDDDPKTANCVFWKKQKEIRPLSRVICTMTTKQTPTL